MAKSQIKGWVHALGNGAMFVAPIVVVCFLYQWCSQIADELMGTLAGWLIRLILRTGQVNHRLEEFVSLILLFISLMLIGRLARWKLGRRGLCLVDLAFEHIPIVRAVYSSVRKLVNALGDSTQQRFQRVVLVNLGGGCELIGLVTGEVSKGGRKHLMCWVPQAPNASSGLLLLVPEEEASELNLTADEALNLIISMGMVTPQTLPLVEKRK